MSENMWIFPPEQRQKSGKCSILLLFYYIPRIWPYQKHRTKRYFERELFQSKTSICLKTLLQRSISYLFDSQDSWQKQTLIKTLFKENYSKVGEIQQKADQGHIFIPWIHDKFQIKILLRYGMVLYCIRKHVILKYEEQILKHGNPVFHVLLMNSEQPSTLIAKWCN